MLLDNDALQLFLTPTLKQRTELVLYDCTKIDVNGLTNSFILLVVNESSGFSLVHLDLVGVYDLDDKALISSLRHSGSTLQYLSLHSADQFLSNNGLSAFSGTFIFSTDQDNNSSKDKNSTGTNNSQLKTSSTVTHQTWKNLHILNLSFVRPTDDSAITTLFSNYPSLSTIHVNKISNVISLTS
ncbi:hypothetical protein AX774_g3254 [Zancudomyces culisetae]|uniref:Uncharacterized protein n=1 Tax=Zancudomyces culisetae TaxID=1213189 RepID=A0A1R1PQL5_ZANCU|nr:hypothetical protein AX774_g3254 [Zancudomyces culisetae]|eukprot:OMH83248.1 hypothetical protein AX774_g3254 [Zancudomyces culisetae]